MSNEIPGFATKTVLEQKLGSAAYVELFDDDNDGEPDPGPLNQVLDSANADMSGRLLDKGYSLENLFDICDSPLLASTACEVAMGYAGERRSEWLDEDGKGRYDKIRENAYERLEMLAKALLKDPVAQGRGKGTTQDGGYVSRYRPPNPTFIFGVDDKDKRNGNPGPGGF